MHTNDLDELPLDKKNYWYTNEILKAEQCQEKHQRWVDYFKEKIEKLNEIKNNQLRNRISMRRQ